MKVTASFVSNTDNMDIPQQSIKKTILLNQISVRKRSQSRHGTQQKMKPLEAEDISIFTTKFSANLRASEVVSTLSMCFFVSSVFFSLFCS